MVSQKVERSASEIFESLFERYPVLTECREQVYGAYEVLLECFRNGGKLLTAGNGGSSADGDHISGELNKSFMFKRPADGKVCSELAELFGEAGADLSGKLEGGLPTIPLTMLAATNTAFSNDVDPKVAVAQLVNTFGNETDVFMGITTSGNSENIVKALMVAKAKNVKTIVLTGKTGGKCRGLCDICICVPETETFKIQELHLPVYHALCAMVEAEIFGNRSLSQ